MNKSTFTALIRDAHDSFVRTAQAVPDDKMNWKPLDNGRCALDLLREVAQTIGMVSKVAQSRGEFKASYDVFQQMRAESADWSREHALQVLETNANALYAAIDSLSEDELAQQVTMPIANDRTMPLSAWIMMSYRTFISRFAQINYIQTLYGDFDAH